MSSNFPNLPVLNRVFANNSRIAPNATSNNTVVDHANFSMAHPQRLPQTDLFSLLNQLDFNNLAQQSNGVLKGNTKDGGDFMLTAGVLKFTHGNHGGGCDYVPPMPPAPPAYTPPATDTGYDAPVADAPVDNTSYSAGTSTSTSMPVDDTSTATDTAATAAPVTGGYDLPPNPYASR